jgi:hypothetical protein
MATPPPLPSEASTATKILFTIGAGALVASPAVVTYSSTLSAILAALGGAALAFGAIVHVYWDHSP